MKVYVCGNESMPFDNAPFRILPKLRDRFADIQFIPVDPNENFPPDGERTLIIIDTVLSINKPILVTIDDLIDIKKTPVSPHDYDLLFHLLLLKKMQKIDTVYVIGLPQQGDDTDSCIALLQQCCDLLDKRIRST